MYIHAAMVLLCTYRYVSAKHNTLINTLIKHNTPINTLIWAMQCTPYVYVEPGHFKQLDVMNNSSPQGKRSQTTVH